MSPRFLLTKRAANELEEIHLFGLRQFGPAQAEKYTCDLERCFHLLALQPQLGRLSPSIRKGMRRHEHGRHVIIYRETHDGILIAGIVHARNIKGLLR